MASFIKKMICVTEIPVELLKMTGPGSQKRFHNEDRTCEREFRMSKEELYRLRDLCFAEKATHVTLEIGADTGHRYALIKAAMPHYVMLDD